MPQRGWVKKMEISRGQRVKVESWLGVTVLDQALEPVRSIKLLFVQAPSICWGNLAVDRWVTAVGIGVVTRSVVAFDGDCHAR